MGHWAISDGPRLGLSLAKMPVPCKWKKKKYMFLYYVINYHRSQLADITPPSNKIGEVVIRVLVQQSRTFGADAQLLKLNICITNKIYASFIAVNVRIEFHVTQLMKPGFFL